MVNTLSKDKNAAFEFCEAEYFLAYKDDKPVGRVAAIINNRANDTWNKKEVRFGWIDFVDDTEVSKALIDEVEKWGKERGMEYVVGPLGFTDMDPEGMLVEGFDQLGTMSTIYNYPYYPEHIEKLGFEKEADWVEFKLKVPEQLPEKFVRISEIILQKYNLKIKKITRKELKEKNYGQKIFDLINEAYAPLYGFSKMTQGQIDQYIKMYLPVIDLRMVSLVEDAAGELVAVGVRSALAGASGHVAVLQVDLYRHDHREVFLQDSLRNVFDINVHVVEGVGYFGDNAFFVLSDNGNDCFHMVPLNNLI